MGNLPATRNSEVFVRILTRSWGKKLNVASILEVKLEMLGIQTKLPECAANLPGSGVVSGWPGPPLIAPFVLKLEKTAIGKKDCRFIELRIGDVARRGPAGEIGHHGHGDTVAVRRKRCQARVFC